jgi:hypothetical protein
MKSMDMQLKCGHCGEVIHEVHTSRFCGGAIPHEKCGNVTTFEAAEPPSEPKVIDVRPIIAPSLKPEDDPRYPEAMEYLTKSCGRPEEAAKAILAKHGVAEIMAGKAEDEREAKAAKLKHQAFEHLFERGYTGEEAEKLFEEYGAEEILTDPRFGNPKPVVDARADSGIEKQDAAKVSDGQAESQTGKDAPKQTGTKGAGNKAQNGK